MTTARRKRYMLFVVLVLVSVSGLLIITRIPKIGDTSWIEKRSCFLPITSPFTTAHPSQEELSKFLPDITSDPDHRQPSPGRSIFFHETSCSVDYKISLTARQACAIESAAKANPERDVFVLFASPRILSTSSSESSYYAAALSAYRNVIFRNVDIWEYSRGTLIEEWINENYIFTSNYVNFHLSDFMRYLSLNKHQGTYLDLDVIVLRNFDEVGGNFAGAESSEDVAAGIINFDDSHFGRQMSELCLRDFKLHYSGEAWGNNGPGVITRVLEKICATSNTTLMTSQRCHGFSVLPPNKCYAIPFRKWERFFDTQQAKEVLAVLEDSVIAHFWNKFSITRKVKVGDGSAYDQLARKHCPKVYAAVGEFF